MATCRVCKFLNSYFRKHDLIMGYSLGLCNKRRVFVWADVVPCPHFKLREDLA